MLFFQVASSEWNGGCSIHKRKGSSKTLWSRPLHAVVAMEMPFPNHPPPLSVEYGGKPSFSLFRLSFSFSLSRLVSSFVTIVLSVLITYASVDHHFFLWQISWECKKGCSSNLRASHRLRSSSMTTVYRLGAPRRISGECNIFDKIWVLEIDGAEHEVSHFFVAFLD